MAATSLRFTQMKKPNLQVGPERARARTQASDCSPWGSPMGPGLRRHSGKGGSREEALEEGHCLLQGGAPAFRRGPRNPPGLSRKGQQGCPGFWALPPLYLLYLWKGHLKPRTLSLSTLGQDHLGCLVAGRTRRQGGTEPARSPSVLYFLPASPGPSHCLSAGHTLGWRSAPWQSGGRVTGPARLSCGPQGGK